MSGESSWWSRALMTAGTVHIPFVPLLRRATAMLAGLPLAQASIAAPAGVKANVTYAFVGGAVSGSHVGVIADAS